jgi:hypothetical protein
MSTLVQRVALIFGVVFLLVGVAGLLTEGGTSMEHGGLLLGLFPVNLAHNIVHILFGVWGIAASRSWDGAKAYTRIGGIIYIVLAILGFIEPDGFGIVPLGGNDIWLHLVLGLVLAGVGFTARPVGASS